MPPREWRLRVEDILESINRVMRYTEGIDETSFSEDEKTVDAVLRNMTVIGEAARALPPEIEARYPNVPWGKMRGFRNVVVHEYFGVSVPILWQTVRTNLPPLLWYQTSSEFWQKLSHLHPPNPVPTPSPAL